MTNERIGELNGKWALAFKTLIVLNASIILPAITWAVALQLKINDMDHKIELGTLDRFSGSMFIEVQDELNNKNPEINWLSASEIRIIQGRNPPYRK